MHTREALPAKLTPPCVARLIARERLYAHLDSAAPARLVWVSAPGGAGKTSLVAAYLAARGRPTLWLRLDAGDGDIDTFLHFMWLALRESGGETMSAPAHTGHPAADEVALRRWMEAAFARMPRGFGLVLDEYQSIPVGAGLHRLLPVIVDSLPDGATLFVASRGDLPATLARVATTPWFARIHAEMLRLAPDEAAALATSVGVLESDAQARLARASGGWAAGLVLLARGMMAGVPLPEDNDGLPREMLDYFSAEVFEQLPPTMRRFLLRTAAMPWITLDMAAALTGHAAPERVLDALHRENLFTERKHGATAVYEYHPLFRRFLAARAREVLDPAELRDIHRLAAHKLAEAGDPEAAVPLFAAMHAWEEIAGIVRDHAPRLAALRRVSTLRSWIECLPEASRAQRPWALFWLAWCKYAMREPAAADVFERAYMEFGRAGDAEGQFAACAWLLRLAGSPEAVERWIGEVERLAARTRTLDPALEARIIARFAALKQFPLRHPLIERWRERAIVLSRAASDHETRVQMASFALARHFDCGEIDAMSALIVEHRHVVDASGVAPRDALPLLLFEGQRMLLAGEDTGAAAVLERAEAVAAETGAAEHREAVANFAFRVALARGDAAAARRSLASVSRAAPTSPQDALARLLDDAELALLEGDADAALAATTAAASPAALCPPQESVRVACRAAAMLTGGETGEAVLAEIAPALETARRQRMPLPQVTLLLLTAFARVRAGESEAAIAALAEGLRLGARLGALPRLPMLPRPMLAELAALALAHNVEPRYAERLVVRLDLRAPANAPPRWPWPVRVRTLGGFCVESRLARNDGVGRNARKPYELLKYVIATGAREVAAGRAIATLWPDLEGDAGKKAFDITLHRLRKALGSDATVRLEGGKLSLDPQLVWVDASAFERLATNAESLLACDDRLADRVLEEALTLYVGHFLAADDDLPWALPHRARLRDRFIRLVDAAGARWESSGDWHRAERRYRDAIALEPAAESIHQRLIRALAATGRPAEALDAYRRCRELLSTVLGTRPSTRTEALYERVRAGAVGLHPVYEK